MVFTSLCGQGPPLVSLLLPHSSKISYSRGTGFQLSKNTGFYSQDWGGPNPVSALLSTMVFSKRKGSYKPTHCIFFDLGWQQALHSDQPVLHISTKWILESYVLDWIATNYYVIWKKSLLSPDVSFFPL